MNIPQAHKQAKLEKLLDQLRLTENNRALAAAYLTAETADDSLLQKAEPEDFRKADWETRTHATDYADDLRKSGDTGHLSRLIKLDWAMGKSTAVFLLERDSDTDTARQERDLRIQLLGKPAAAAMEAEKLAWRAPYYKEQEWLYTLAAQEPETLVEAQRLNGSQENYRVMLAGILLAANQKPGLLQRLLGGKTALLSRQIELIHRNNIETMPATASNLTSGERQALMDYIQKGDLSAPVPAQAAGRLDPRSVLASRKTDAYLTGLLGMASFLGAEQDPRLRCAVRVYLTFQASAVLNNILRGTSQSFLLDQPARLDHLVEDLPGGAVTMQLFLAESRSWDGRGGFYKAICRRCASGLQRAMELADAQRYTRLMELSPNNSGGITSVNSREKMVNLICKYVQTGKGSLLQYLNGTGSLRDTAARLSAVTTGGYVYTGQAAQMINRYRRAAGWDEFACRCMVVFGLVFQGSSIHYLISLDSDLDGLASALLKRELPVGELMQMFGFFYDNSYDDKRKNRIRDKLREALHKSVYLDDLCTQARDGSVFGRYVALSALDDLSTSPDCGSKAKAAILACAGDSSKQIQELMLALLSSHCDWADDLAGLLKSKKAADRLMAVRAAAKIGEEMRPALEAALAGEKSAKVAEAIRSALGQEAPQPEQAEALGVEQQAAQILKGGKKRKIQWLLDAPLPALHLQDEARTEASEDRRAALLVAYCELGRIGRSETAALLAQGIEKADLAALAAEVYERWLAAGAQSKTKWVLAFAAAFGGAAMTPRLSHAINEWPQQSRGAIACDAVTALALSDDPAALLIVDSISRKFKFRQVKAAAASALENAAKELGITAEELADRIVPDLGFSADGRRTFDYGPRSFTVRLTPTLELEITNDAGKTVKNMPAPGKTDDPARAEAAYAEFKTMKKQIRTTVTAQKARLEAALSVLRCWTSDAWQALFVKNPIMHQFAMSLIWGVYQDGQLQQTFRYMEDGSFNTVDEEEYTLPEGARIGLAHPVELDQDTLDAWKQQLEDYEITQSIPQLERPVFRLEPGTETARSLDRFGGRMLNGLSLSGKLLGLGWYRGSVQDAGGYYTFYREDPDLGLGVELEFSGCFVGDENETVTVYQAVFYRQGTVQRGSYCYDVPKQENIFALGDVPPRYYSEVVYQLDKATASSTESDPDWKKKAN